MIKRVVTLVAMTSIVHLLSLGIANGTVLTDPVIFSGSDSIDPAGAQDIDAYSEISKTTLESISDLYVLQNFTGFSGYSMNSTNFINFTDDSRADIKFEIIDGGTSITSTSGGETTGDGGTSAGSGIVLDGTSKSSGEFTLRISFGEYNNIENTFDESAKGVNTACFTLCQYRLGINYTVVFRNSAGDALITFSGGALNNTDGNGSHGDRLYSYTSDGTDANAITSIDITRAVTSTYAGQTGQILDDLGTTSTLFGTIPTAEPMNCYVLYDPYLSFGTNSIDPDGDLDATSGPAKTILEAQTDFAVVQDFINFESYSISDMNAISFLDPAWPDLKCEILPGGNNINSSSGKESLTDGGTSAGSALYLNGASKISGSFTYRISFGDYNEIANTFTAGSKNVNSAGFTLANYRYGLNYIVKFKNSNEDILASYSGGALNNRDGLGLHGERLYSYISDGTEENAISSIDITRYISGTYAATTGQLIDDFGFTPIIGATPLPTETAYYMTVYGAGNHDGSDWDNAFGLEDLSPVSCFNNTLLPGETLYIGSGTYNTGGTLTTGGTLGNPKKMIGMDTGGGLPIFDRNDFNENAPESSDNSWSVLSLGNDELDYVEIKNLILKNARYGIYTSRTCSGWKEDLLLENITVQHVNIAFQFVRLLNSEIKNCSAFEYTKQGFRFEYNNDGITVVDCVADCVGPDRDPDIWWSKTLNYPYGFDLTAGPGADYNRNFLFDNCLAMNNRKAAQGDVYWNGDGFCIESDVVDITFWACRSFDNDDAGYDCKPQATFVDCIAFGNKRNFRAWYGNTTYMNCVAGYAGKAGGTSSDCGLWVQDASVSVYDCTFHADSGYSIHEDNNGNVTVIDSILSFSGSAGTFKVGNISLDSSTSTYRPGYGTDPAYVNPFSSWMGDDPVDAMNSQTWGTAKGWNSDNTVQ